MRLRNFQAGIITWTILPTTITAVKSGNLLFLAQVRSNLIVALSLYEQGYCTVGAIVCNEKEMLLCLNRQVGVNFRLHHLADVMSHSIRYIFRTLLVYANAADVKPKDAIDMRAVSVSVIEGEVSSAMGGFCDVTT